MNEDLFKGLEPPVPPPGLREAAIRAGRQALRTEAPADAWSRLLLSVPARLAWAASVVLLLGAHALLPAIPPRAHAAASVVGAPGARGVGSANLAAATSRAEPEITALARLPRIEDRALAAQPGDRS